MNTSHIFMIASLLIAVQFSTQALAKKPVKPPPLPVTAEDVICDGCVGTTDIEDGAVTQQKLSSGVNDLLSTISELQGRLDALEAATPTPILKIYAGDIFLGYLISEYGNQSESLVFEPSSGYFAVLVKTVVDENTVITLRSRMIYFENMSCDGVGLIINSDDANTLTPFSDTPNILYMNGNNFYRTVGVYTGPRNILIHSQLEASDGTCTSVSYSFGNQNAVVEQVDYPLPYSLPITVPLDGLRMEFMKP